MAIHYAESISQAKDLEYIRLMLPGLSSVQTLDPLMDGREGLRFIFDDGCRVSVGHDVTNLLFDAMATTVRLRHDAMHRPKP